jgi:uncharacterized protein YfaT (DUF1175 family)
MLAYHSMPETFYMVVADSGRFRVWFFVVVESELRRKD